MTSLHDPAALRIIADRLGRLTPNAQARWGRMSSHQAICHLTDSFLGCLGEKQVSSATGLFQRTVMKWGALYLPIPWPKGVPTRPEVEQGAGGTLPSDFERDRRELMSVTERFCDASRECGNDVHPIFGRMSRSQWMRWGWLHLDHHLRQFGV